MKNRDRRLAVIADILKNQEISNQEELLRQLVPRGFVITQATLSRDLKHLKTTKIATEHDGYRYVIAEPIDLSLDAAGERSDTGRRGLHPSVHSLAVAGNTLVLKTRNGYASGVAYDLDLLGSPLILGTIAGGDTVFAILNEESSRVDLYELLSSFVQPEVLDKAEQYF